MANRESMSGTTLHDYTDQPIIDQYGNSWALTRGHQVQVDGIIDRTTGGVTVLAYINRQVWQWVETKRLWWSKASPLAPWLPPEGTPNAPFGPTPDPRLDQIITALAALSASDGAGFGSVSGQLEVIAGAVEQIPTNPTPDPHVAQLVNLVTRGFAAQHAAMVALSTRIEMTNAALAEAAVALSARFDTVDQAQATAAELLAANAAQVHRIIVMLLDLFPTQRPHIVLGRPSFTSQGAPGTPGP